MYRGEKPRETKLAPQWTLERSPATRSTSGSRPRTCRGPTTGSRCAATAPSSSPTRRPTTCPAAAVRAAQADARPPRHARRPPDPAPRLPEERHPDRRLRPPGRHVPVRHRSRHVGARHRLPRPRGRQPLRRRHELLPEHRRGQPGADGDGQRACASATTPGGGAAAARPCAGLRALFGAVHTWGRGGEGRRGGAGHPEAPEGGGGGGGRGVGGRALPAAPRRAQGSAARPAPPEPAALRGGRDQDMGSGSVRFAKDFVGVDYHNDGHSHIDAFCHVAYEGRLYGGAPDTAVTDGAQSGSVDILKDGLIGRGVLLDVPRLRGVPWLEPGEDVYLGDLEAAEQAEGHHRRARRHLPGSHWPFPAPGRARSVEHGRGQGRPASRDGVVSGRASCRRSRLRRQQRHGSEHDRRGRVPDARPRPQRDGGAPLDYLQLDEVARLCEQEGRWEFLFTAAPLRVVRGTGSPINPIAVSDRAGACHPPVSWARV